MMELKLDQTEHHNHNSMDFNWLFLIYGIKIEHLPVKIQSNPEAIASSGRLIIIYESMLYHQGFTGFIPSVPI